MKREDLEAKVTALLLGELPESEAALLRELIARDAGLARLQSRLKLTLELLRETAAAPEPAPAAPLKMSESKREKLLAQFKTVAPKEFAPRPRRVISWPLAVAAVAALAMIAVFTLPRLAARFELMASIGEPSSKDSSTWPGLVNGGAPDHQPYFGRGEHAELPAPPPEPKPIASANYYTAAGARPPAAGARSPIALPAPSALSQPAPELALGDKPAIGNNFKQSEFADQSPVNPPAPAEAPPAAVVAADGAFLNVNGNLEARFRPEGQIVLPAPAPEASASSILDLWANRRGDVNMTLDTGASNGLITINRTKGGADSSFDAGASPLPPLAFQGTPNDAAPLANRFARRPGARAPATPPPASALSDTNAYPQSLLGGDRNIGAGGTPAVASGATDYGFGNAVPVETNGLSPQATNQEEYKLNAVGYINAELLPGYNVVTVPLSNLENTITSSVQEGSQGQQQPPQQGANEFQWNLGTTVMKNGAIGLQGGTAPSYQGPSATANPSGLFPGGVSPSTTTPVPFTPEPGVVAASAADASLTLGLRRRPGNGQVGASNFTVDKDTGQVFIIADDATTSSASQVVSNQAVHNSNNPFITRYAYEVTPRERDKLSGVKQGEWQLHIEEADQNKNLETGLTGKAGERAQEAEQLVRSRQDNLGVKDDSFSFANNTATNVTSFSLLEDQQKIAGDTKESGKAALAPQALAPPANTNEPANISYNFSGVPVEQVLDTYGKLVGRTLLKSTTGPADVPKDATITLKTEKPLTRSEAIESLETILGRNGVTVVNIGDKAAKVVIDTMAGKEGGSIKPVAPPLTPQPEVLTSANIFSTFSLNVSDAAFKLAQAGLQNGVMPDPASIRSEEFINAFDYRDPEPAPGAPLGFAWERAAYPFAHNRDLLRFSVKTAAQGRQPGRPLNLVLLLDKSGSMERADRVEIIHQALRVLASQLNAQDTLSVVVFARTARLWVDGAPGSQAGEVANRLDSVTPEGGTNLEEAMRLAYQTALRHYNAGGENRVVLMTDGAANLGNVEPESLKQNVEANRKQGIALDCFGIGWDGYNDNLMETLSRTGHGRYGFINTPEEAATEFAGQLAGALRVAASDVKVQVEFNPNRVASWRQIGYAKHQLTKEQFRDNTVAAAQIGAAESGNALYTVEVNPLGDGPLCTVRARFHAPGSTDVQEHAWDVPYTGTATPLDTASPAMRLAATSSAFSEWLAGSPYAVEVTPDQLLAYLRGVPEIYGADARPKNLEWMIRQAKSISGK